MKHAQQKVVYCLLVMLTLGCGGGEEQISLIRGLVLRESVHIRPGTYLIPGDSANQEPVITVLGRDLDINFQGAVLQGISDHSGPVDEHGTAIFVDQATNVVLRNLTVKGYQTAIICRSCMNLELENVDLSDNEEQVIHRERP